jgi:hypothetical protein
MSIEMFDVLRHLRALNLPEDADQIDELCAVQALAELWELPMAKAALEAEKRKANEQIDKMVTLAVDGTEQYGDLMVLIITRYQAAVLGINEHTKDQHYLVACGRLPLEVSEVCHVLCRHQYEHNIKKGYRQPLPEVVLDIRNGRDRMVL